MCVFIRSSTLATFASCTQWVILYLWWLWCWHLASSYSSGKDDAHFSDSKEKSSKVEPLFSPVLQKLCASHYELC